MATLLPNGKQQFDNSAGAPLVGGKLYTYDAGTTNPRTTWQDSNATVPNTNPVVLDARGEATVFWSGVYKVILKDASDNTIWSLDNINSYASDEQLRLDLANSVSPTKGSFLTSVYFNILGYIGRTLSAWIRDRAWHPRDFGAVGDGVIDDTAAITAMFAAMTANRKTSAASVAFGMTPKADFGDYRYKISASVSPPNYSHIVANGASLEPTTNTFDIFSNVGFETSIEGFTFAGGQRAIKIATGNVDTTTIRIRNNSFLQQTVAAVETDSNSASTRLLIEGNKTYNVNAGVIIYKIVTCDVCTIDDAWATVAGVFVQSGDATHQAEVIVNAVCGVPAGGATIWGINYSSLTFKPGVRFGGESAATLVDNYAKVDATVPNTLRIDRAQAHCAGNYAVRFFAVPNVFEFHTNRGLVSSNGFYFDGGITSANMLLLRSYLAKFDIKGNVQQNISWRGAPEPMARAIALQAEYNGGASLLVTDKVYQARANSATGGVLANVTVVNNTGTFGEPTRNYTGTTGTYNGSISETWNAGFTGQPNGTYTAVYIADVQSDHPVAITFFCGDLDTVMVLPKGKHVINVPAYWNSSTSQNLLGWSLTSLNNQQIIEMSNVRLFKGTVRVSTINSVLYADAVPATMQWEVGDIVQRKTATSGSWPAQRCTAAGVPGTWKAEANLA